MLESFCANFVHNRRDQGDIPNLLYKKLQEKSTQIFNNSSTTRKRGGLSDQGHLFPGAIDLGLKLL